jgi:hypothetical protein
VTQKESGNVQVPTPNGIVQRCVCLGIASVYVGLRASTEKHLYSLEALVAPDETSASDGKLQRELAPPFQASTSHIWLGVTLQEQPHRTNVGLAHSLVQSMLALTCMPTLQSRPQQRN